MVLRCSHCRSKFQVDDALRGKTFRCRTCASPIKADGGEEAKPAGRSAGVSRPATPSKSMKPGPSAAPRTAAARVDAAPPSVASRRDDERSRERSKRDLFGQELQLSARVVEHNESPFTAARNENSVLFSLDQLAKPRLPETVPAAAPVRAKADSGLIDLNALMDAPLNAKSVRPAPLSEPPLGAFTREVDSVPPAHEIAVPAFRGGQKKGKLIAAASAAAVFLFVGVGLFASSREDARVEAAAKAAAQPVAAQPVATAVAEAPAPPPPVAAAPAETKSTASKPAGKAGPLKGGPRKGAKKGAAASASVPAAPAAPKKAADPCGCRGDLLCNMKCSSK